MQRKIEPSVTIEVYLREKEKIKLNCWTYISPLIHFEERNCVLLRERAQIPVSTYISANKANEILDLMMKQVVDFAFSKVKPVITVLDCCFLATWGQWNTTLTYKLIWRTCQPTVAYLHI